MLGIPSFVPTCLEQFNLSSGIAHTRQMPTTGHQTIITLQNLAVQKLAINHIQSHMPKTGRHTIIKFQNLAMA